jgi:dCMP deaminase
MPSEKTWHSRWLGVAFQVATWSKDPSSKHGCVSVIHNRQISFGYNGMPEKTDDQILLTPEKYQCVQHSEGNMISNAARCGHCTDGATVYVTGQPCLPCLGLLINAGIKRLIYHPLWTTVLGDDDQWSTQSQLFHKLIKESKLDFLTHGFISSPQVAFFKGKEYQLEVDNFNGM